MPTEQQITAPATFSLICTEVGCFAFFAPLGPPSSGITERNCIALLYKSVHLNLPLSLNQKEIMSYFSVKIFFPSQQDFLALNCVLGVT